MGSSRKKLEVNIFNLNINLFIPPIVRSINLFDIDKIRDYMTLIIIDDF